VTPASALVIKALAAVVCFIGVGNLLRKIRLEIAVNDSFVERTVEAIIRGAQTGQTGDGKIFISSLEDCVRIRTKERGPVAIG